MFAMPGHHRNPAPRLPAASPYRVYAACRPAPASPRSLLPIGRQSATKEQRYQGTDRYHHQYRAKEDRRRAGVRFHQKRRQDTGKDPPSNHGILAAHSFVASATGGSYNDVWLLSVRAHQPNTFRRVARVPRDTATVIRVVDREIGARSATSSLVRARARRRPA